MHNYITITSGQKIPAVGLGLWKIDQDQVAAMIVNAIKAGYRHLDSAADYGNEVQTGEGIAKALQTKLCSRDELWVTSKLWNTHHRPEHVRSGIEKTLRDLQLDHLDLYLIHFPIALRYVAIEDRYPPGWVYDPSAASPRMQPDQVPLAETWGAMEELQRAGLTRNIGVCNYNSSLMHDLLSYAAIRPAVLQVESHPYLTQDKLLRFCQQENIAVTAFSPLGAGSYVPLGMAEQEDSVLKHQVVQSIANEVGKTAAQVVLRWGVQRGTAVIPKTSQVERLAENMDLFNFELSTDQMRQISELNQNRRFNDPGEFCEAAFGCFYPIYE